MGQNQPVRDNVIYGHPMDAPSWLALLGLGGGLIPKYRGGDRTLIR